MPDLDPREPNSGAFPVGSNGGDPTEEIVEVYPGFHDELHTDIEATGGWVCEEHPDLPWPHDDCPGPGMPARDVEDSDGCFVRRQHPHPPDRLASAVRYTP